MNFCIKLYFTTFCLFLNFYTLKGYRVFDRIYETVEGDFACFKRFNGTHEIGCTSSFWGNVGVIHFVKNDSDLSWIINEGPHSPYILVITPDMFITEVLRKAEVSQKVAGIVLLQSEQFSRPTSFSGEKKCPNDISSLYASTLYNDYCPAQPWNPPGSSIMYENWSFPMFLIRNETSVQNILTCFTKFNAPGSEADWPLCAIELSANMYGTTNSEVCVRRSQKTVFAPPEGQTSFCDPLEDANIWNTFSPLNKSVEILEKSIILVSTSADASSMFDKISPGANAAVSGLVTLLLTAETLYSVKDEIDNIGNGKNLMFAIFEGEAWDYIGSSRMVYDMIKNQFPYAPKMDQTDQMTPINLTHFDTVIDIGQVGQLMGNSRNSKKIYMHTDPISNSDEAVKSNTDRLIQILRKSNDKIKFEEVNPDMPIPPSSFQSFLKHHNISGVVLTDHEKEFHNQHYNSIYDDINNVNYNETLDSDELHKDLAYIASSLSSSLYFVLTGKEKKFEPNFETSNDLLYCYLRNTNCSQFRLHSDENINYLPEAPARMYVSVKYGESHLSYLTGRILSHFTGITVDLNQTICKTNDSQVYSLEYFPYMDNGTCIKSTKHHSKALSPAFVIDNYDWKSGDYSTWTESSWARFSARIFLRPSPLSEGGLIVGGLSSVVLSILIVYFIFNKADILFPFEISPEPVPC